MFRLTRSSVYPIGLDIGHESVKMLQLGRAGDSLSVVACAQSAVIVAEGAGPEERSKAVIEAIRQALRRGLFRGRKAVAALPREVLHVRNLRLPPMPAGELPGIVQFEAKNVLPFDPGEAMIEFLPAGEVRQGAEVRQEVIMLGAKNQDVDRCVEMIGQSGVTLEGLDIQPCALYRTVDRFIRRREDEHEVNVMVDVGAQRSQVVIGKGKEINFIKLIEIGARHFQNAVSRKLGISLEEAHSLARRLAETPLADNGSAGGAHRDPVRQAANDATRALMEELGREIALCLRYYSVTFRGQRPIKVRVVGGAARDPQLLVVLNRVLPIPSEIARVLLSVDTSRMSIEDRRGPMTDWAVALGLAMKCIEGSFGARDGKPRALTREEAAIAAHLTDINNGLRAAGDPGAEASTNNHRDAHVDLPSESFAAKFAPRTSAAVSSSVDAAEAPKADIETLEVRQSAASGGEVKASAAPVAVPDRATIATDEPPRLPAGDIAGKMAATSAEVLAPGALESPVKSESSRTLSSDSAKWRVLAPNGVEPPAVPPHEMPGDPNREPSVIGDSAMLEASHA